MSRTAIWTLGIGVALVLLLAISGAIWLLEVPFFLAFGWIRYVTRVLPLVNFDWPTIGFACAVVAVFTVGLHAFFRWLAAAVDSQSANTWKPRWTISIVAMSLLLFAAGTAFVGVVHQVTWLAQSPVPLLEGGIRQAARRSQSSSQVKQMALASLDQVETQGFAGDERTSGADQPVHSWQTEMLPYIEEAQLYQRVQRDLPWDHESNRAALSTTVEIYESPYSSANGQRLHDRSGYALSDYSANEHVVKDGKRIDFNGMTDGASHTLLHGEALKRRRPWGKLGNVRDPAAGINQSSEGFNGAAGTAGAVFSYADGRASFIPESIDPDVLRALSTPAGDEEIGCGIKSD
jgi:hypothetical protein